jgi:hypothetical protein
LWWSLFPLPLSPLELELFPLLLLLVSFELLPAPEVEDGTTAGDVAAPITAPGPAPSTAPPDGGDMPAAGGEEGGICCAGAGPWRTCFFGAFREGLGFGFAWGFADGRTTGDVERGAVLVEGAVIAGRCGAASVGVEAAACWTGVRMPPVAVAGGCAVTGAGEVFTGAEACVGFVAAA